MSSYVVKFRIGINWVYVMDTDGTGGCQFEAMRCHTADAATTLLWTAQDARPVAVPGECFKVVKLVPKDDGITFRYLSDEIDEEHSRYERLYQTAKEMVEGPSSNYKFTCLRWAVEAITAKKVNG